MVSHTLILKRIKAFLIIRANTWERYVLTNSLKVLAIRRMLEFAKFTFGSDNFIKLKIIDLLTNRLGSLHLERARDGWPQRRRLHQHHRRHLLRHLQNSLSSCPIEMGTDMFNYH